MLFATQAMVVFGVITLIAEELIDVVIADGLLHRRWKLR